MKTIIKLQLKDGLCLYDATNQRYYTIKGRHDRNIYICTVDEVIDGELITVCHDCELKKRDLMHLEII